MKQSLGTPIVIFGAGKIAFVLNHYIKNDPFCLLDPVGFVVDDEFIPKSRIFADLPCVPWSDVERVYPPDRVKMMVAIGYHNLNKLRTDKLHRALDLGYAIEDYVCSDGRFNKGLSVGENTIILDRNTVQPGSIIGHNVMMFPGNNVSHGTWIKNNAWITSGVSIGGDVRIGENTFIGMNATIGHSVRIGDNNFIGAGAIVVTDTLDNSVYLAPTTQKYSLDTDKFLKLVAKGPGGGF